MMMRALTLIAALLPFAAAADLVGLVDDATGARVDPDARYLQDAPSDNNWYVRQDAAWVGLEVFDVDLTADVIGVLPIANGGTGVSALSSLNLNTLGSGAATVDQVPVAQGDGSIAWSNIGGSTWVAAPNGPTDSCNPGDHAWAAPYLYVCVSAATWVRLIPETSW